jgi:hypothetical protein
VDEQKNYHELYIALGQEVVHLRRQIAELEVALGQERLGQRQHDRECPRCGYVWSE